MPYSRHAKYTAPGDTEVGEGRRGENDRTDIIRVAFAQ